MHGSKVLIASHNTSLRNVREVMEKTGMGQPMATISISHHSEQYYSNDKDGLREMNNAHLGADGKYLLSDKEVINLTILLHHHHPHRLNNVTAHVTLPLFLTSPHIIIIAIINSVVSGRVIHPLFCRLTLRKGRMTIIMGTHTICKMGR